MTSLKMLPGGLVLSMLARSIPPSVRALAPSLHLTAFCYKSDIGRLIEMAARQRLLSLACDAPAAAMGPEADARPCPTSTALPFFAMLVRAQFLWSGTPAHWPGLETSYLLCAVQGNFF